MQIVYRPQAHRYSVSRSPIKPWGVLLHTTEGGSKAGLDNLFIYNERSDGVTVSVHFCIYADGEIRCYAPWQPGKAWYCYHAGKSYFKDPATGDAVNGCSLIFLGIELQHRAGETYSQAMLDSLVWLLKGIQAAYKDEPYWRNILTEHRVVAPSRKSDPTAPWDNIKGPIYRAWNAQGEEDDMTPEDRALIETLIETTKHLDNTQSQQLYRDLFRDRTDGSDWQGAKQLLDAYYLRWPAAVGPFKKGSSAADLEAAFGK